MFRNTLIGGIKIIYAVLSIALLAYVIYTDTSLLPQTPQEALKIGLYAQLCLASITILYELYKVYEDVNEMRKKD